MSFDLHSINFSNVQDEKKDLYKYIYSSLDGTIYDIAQNLYIFCIRIFIRLRD